MAWNGEAEVVVDALVQSVEGGRAQRGGQVDLRLGDRVDGWRRGHLLLPGRGEDVSMIVIPAWRTPAPCSSSARTGRWSRRATCLPSCAWPSRRRRPASTP